MEYYLDAGKAAIALIIPPHFSRELLRKTQPNVQLLMDGQDSNTSGIAMGYASEIIQSFTRETLQETVLKKPQLAKKIHTLEPEINVWYNPNLIAQNYMVPGIVVLLLTVITMLLTSMGDCT